MNTDTNTQQTNENQTNNNDTSNGNTNDTNVKLPPFPVATVNRNPLSNTIRFGLVFDLGAQENY